MSLRARAVIALVTLAWMTLGWGLASAQPLRVAPEADIQRGDYRIVQWTTAQGLPQNTVNDIVLLPNGELWVATFGGLARFDGHRFHVVDMATDEGLPANRIVSLAMAGADAFWFLTQQGHLGRVERGRPRLLVAPPSPPVDTLGLLAVRGGRLFCKSTDGGLWQTDGTQAWQRVTDGSRRDGVVQSVSETDDGGVWATWGGQLVQIAGGTTAAPVAVREPYVATFRRKNGGLWVGLGPRIARFLDGRIEHLDIQPPLQHQVTVIAVRRRRLPVGGLTG